MGNIMIIDNQPTRLELLSRYLKDTGHEVKSIGDDSNENSIDFSDLDLIILNLYPDVNRTWEFYLNFKTKYPNLPVLVYVQHDIATFKSLKHIIASIIPEKGRRCRTAKAEPRRKEKITMAFQSL